MSEKIHPNANKSKRYGLAMAVLTFVNNEPGLHLFVIIIIFYILALELELMSSYVLDCLSE